MKAGKRRCRLRLGTSLLVLGCLCAAVGLLTGLRLREAIADLQPMPAGTTPPYTPWPTPSIAREFDYPLQPPDAYSPYAQGITGSRAIDTRFGAQNPAFGNRSNCLRDSTGNAVPFSQLYHAEEFAVRPVKAAAKPDDVGVVDAILVAV